VQSHACDGHPCRARQRLLVRDLRDEGSRLGRGIAAPRGCRKRDVRHDRDRRAGGHDHRARLWLPGRVRAGRRAPTQAGSGIGGRVDRSRLWRAGVVAADRSVGRSPATDAFRQGKDSSARLGERHPRTASHTTPQGKRKIEEKMAGRWKTPFRSRPSRRHAAGFAPVGVPGREMIRTSRRSRLLAALLLSLVIRGGATMNPATPTVPASNRVGPVPDQCERWLAGVSTRGSRA